MFGLQFRGMIYSGFAVGAQVNKSHICQKRQLSRFQPVSNGFW